MDIIDFHSHILPGADHGSSSLETSLSQLRLARDAGVTRIVATPHFYPHRHTLEHFLDKRTATAEKLYGALEEGMPQVKLGAEVLLCPGLENFANLDKLCLNGTNYMLLELPFVEFRDEYTATVENIMRSGIEIILAHVDRYPKENIQRMYDAGVRRFQLNADSLAKIFRQKHLIKWAEKGLVVALGSDIHGADAKAYKNFCKAQKVLGDSLATISKKSDEIFEKIL